MNSLLLRSLSGIVFVALIIGATLWTPWSFYGIWAVVGLLSVSEYGSLVQRAEVFRQQRILPMAIGIIYIIGSIYTITTLEPMMVITILTIVWANDTGAYIVGSTIGRHKMFPRISPKKSWEGFFGGLVFAISVALIWYVLYWTQADQVTIAGKIEWLIMGLLIGIASVIGDLIESKFKRTIGVKDSGKLIPGHGGILDRIDATLLAVPVAWLYHYFVLI